MRPKYEKIGTEVIYCSAEKNGGTDFRTKTTLLIEDGRKLFLFENHRTELPSVQTEMDETWDHQQNAKIQICK